MGNNPSKRSRSNLLIIAASAGLALAACGTDPATAGTDGASTGTSGTSTGANSSSGADDNSPDDNSPDDNSPDDGGTTISANGESSGSGTTAVANDDTGTGTSTGATAGSDTTSGSEESGSSTGEPAECDNLPALPIDYVTVSGPTASEDFVLDSEGYMLNVANGGDLLRANYGGPSSLVFPGVGSGFAAGTAMLSNGDVVFNDPGAGQVIRVGTDGTTTIIANGVSYPNGLTVDLDDIVYVAENNGGRVLRVDPDSLSVEAIAEDLPSPNGLAFDPSYENLYVGSFGDGTVHQINIESGDVVEFASNIGTGGLDGIVVDECNNVYVTDFGPGVIYKVEGQNHELVVDLPSGWIPNMHFGSGVGGWDNWRLYVIDINDDQLYELDLGVRGIPLPQL
ncbi:MAG: SMP-30/gluconolactonase/LRE family protein [Nannocystaceae bacterium]|nr:SMP-30/gluconolactonase/LRE family protein [Nannocystaceae bacterium]